MRLNLFSIPELRSLHVYSLCSVTARVFFCVVKYSSVFSEYITLLNAVITIAIRLRYDYDPTTMCRARLLPFDAIRREQKMNMSIFRRSRIVVESQL